MEPTDENIRAWDKAHRAPPSPEEELPQQVKQSVTDLHGKRVLHLNCGTGAATAQFAELGASVTGVDPSEESIYVARQRAPTVLFIGAEPHALPAELQRGRFDLVYAGPATLQQLRDLELFSGNVAAALRAGGDLLMFDDHPAALCVDGLMHWREDYFAAGFHRLGQIVGALARHHIPVRALEEYPAAPSTYRDARIPGTFLLHARKDR
jgi:SAM-dependent methyltransferase